MGYRKLAAPAAAAGMRSNVSVPAQLPAGTASGNVCSVIEPKPRSLTERLLGRPRLWVGWTWVGLALCWFALALIHPSPFRFFIAALWLLVGALNLVGAYHARRRAAEEAATKGAITSDPSSDSVNH